MFENAWVDEASVWGFIVEVWASIGARWADEGKGVLATIAAAASVIKALNDRPYRFDTLYTVKWSRMQKWIGGEAEMSYSRMNLAIIPLATWPSEAATEVVDFCHCLLPEI